MSDEILTAKEAAKMLRLGLDSFYAAVNRGDIPHRRVGRKLLFSRQALTHWINGGGKESTWIGAAPSRTRSHLTKAKVPANSNRRSSQVVDDEADFDEISASHSVG